MSGPVLPVVSARPDLPVGPVCSGSGAAHSPAEAAVAVLVGRVADLHRVSGGNVMECFAAVPDPRRRRGVRHSLPTILGLCTAAMLSGQVRLTDITDWVRHHADEELLAGLGCRRGGDTRWTPPHPDTIERVFTALGAGPLADGLGSYLLERARARWAGAGQGGPVTFPVAEPAVLPAIAVDGKAVRGAIGPDGAIPYLLAAATHHESAVIAERLIGPKTNEVRREAPCRISHSVRRNSEDGSWVRWLTRS